jgi:uncharacterized repeat protein (TIGR01451 family)
MICDQPVTIIFQADLASDGVPDVIINTVWFSGTKTPPTTVEEPIYTTPLPDLSTSIKEVTPDVVYAGENLTFTITLVNTGTGAGTVDLSDDIPADTTYVSVEGATWYPLGPRIGWSGIITEGTSHVITLVVETDAGLADGTLITNTAEFDADTTSYSKSATAIIADTTAAASVELAASTTSAVVDDTVYLTATVKDRMDEPIADGEVVTFTTDLGTLGSDTITKVTTGGVATATLTSDVSGTAHVTATADAVSDSVDVEFGGKIFMPIIMKNYTP